MKVAVVGLGAAGLRSAQLLEAAGAEVETFEARTRTGGRIETFRSGGTLYEAGAEWIDADHGRLLGLMSELGVRSLPSTQWPGSVVHSGSVSQEDLLWPDALEDELRVEAAAREMCRSLKSPPWSNHTCEEWDRETLAGFIRSTAQSERGRWWVTAKYRSDEGDDPERVGLLGWLCGYLHYVQRDDDAMSAFRADGGMGRVCDGMAESLSCSPRLGWVLRRVSEEADSVRLDFDQGSFLCDRAVLTLPPRALERIVFDPPLSSSKRCAIEACGMSRAIKISLEFDRRWWIDKEWSGRMLWDGPLQQTWDAGLGKTPVLSSYICGREAEAMRARKDPVGEAVEALAGLHPEARKSFAQGRVHDWIGDPWALGAFSHLGPGMVLGHMRHLSEPEGRIHFAGEHTAVYSGFVEGALESAERVAREVAATEPVPR